MGQGVGLMQLVVDLSESPETILMRLCHAIHGLMDIYAGPGAHAFSDFNSIKHACTVR
jgi:hypothetical protein